MSVLIFVATELTLFKKKKIKEEKAKKSLENVILINKYTCNFKVPLIF